MRTVGHGWLMRWAAAGVLALAAAGAGCGGGSGEPGTADAPRDRLQAEVARELRSTAGYAGPRDGPRARRLGTIAFVASDLTNGGVAGVAQGVRQAAGRIGWRMAILDGEASVGGRRAALRRALALRPGGLILGGFDATEQRWALREAARRRIPVVGWHAAPRPGADAAPGLFANVTTDPLAVARLAARYVIADSGGHAGVVIFTDRQFTIAAGKARAMKAALESCARCAVLGVEDVPIADALERMPSVVSGLLERHGRRMTYMLAVNGNYFAGSRAALIDAGRKGTDPPYAVAAGDGDASELERIRSHNYQRASVAEPLYLQGWQLVDELNRAAAGRPASGYLAPPHLITAADAPAGGVYDPATGYRKRFASIWGV